MNSEPDSGRGSLIETLFSRAADLSPPDCVRFLDQACGYDDMLRGEIESLLAADAADDRFIETAIRKIALQVPESDAVASEGPMAGRIVGPYRVIKLIGHGGMGAVYRAVRQDQFRMQVALKLIKRGADTDLAIHQFKKEQQILAQLQPDYASPEQVMGLPLTTATDIYSSGVVLYELLTGERPYRVKTPTTNAIEEAICHEEPRPPASICKQIDGDLSNIVLMALRKEPQRRYTSVQQLSDDIQRYLDGRPILARRDTVSYRCRKFVQRHTLGVAASLLIAAGLVIGVSAVENEAVRTQRRFQQVRKLANTMIFDLHDEIALLPGATKARHSLVNTAIEYLDSLAGSGG